MSKSKKAAGGDSASTQLCLRYVALPVVVPDFYSRVCTCAVGMNTAGFIFCEDAPWKCPKSVPPTCNTGVHDLGSAAASEDQTLK